MASLTIPGLKKMDNMLFGHLLLRDEDLEEKESARKRVIYLVTLPHPRFASDSPQDLRAPESYTHDAIVKAFLSALERPEEVDAAAASRGPPTDELTKVVVFQEHHAADEAGKAHVHYHVALAASQPFAFAAYKRASRKRYHLASHWSCSHDVYWSTVRHGFMPSPKKTQNDRSPYDCPSTDPPLTLH